MPRRRKEISFEEFWNAYALKLDRQRAEKAWKRLSAKDRGAAFAGIVPYRENCQRLGISMMYAQGYLNHRRWEDEIPAVDETPVSVSVGKADGSLNMPEGMEKW